jgi:hypothetical protein
MNFTGLTPRQKMEALSFRFYSNQKWAPAALDYYTTSRNDLELYQVVRIDDEFVYTVYTTDPKKNESKWKRDEFTTQGFGPCRVWVPLWILTEYKEL